MDDVIKRACAALGIDPAQVLSSHINAELGQVSIVADNGIAGCPKLTIPFSELPSDEPATTTLDTSSMLKAELAEELERLGLSTDGKKAELKARLDEAIS